MTNGQNSFNTKFCELSVSITLLVGMESESHITLSSHEMMEGGISQIKEDPSDSPVLFAGKSTV